jgi:hypothetical protein
MVKDTYAGHTFNDILRVVVWYCPGECTSQSETDAFWRELDPFTRGIGVVVN